MHEGRPFLFWLSSSIRTIRNNTFVNVPNATVFGYSGTYWDYVQEIAAERKDIGKLINLHLSKDEVANILVSAGFKGYRLAGALAWIMEACRMIRGLC